MKQVLFVVFMLALSVFPSSVQAAIHTDCQNYCDANCWAAIEAKHNELGGCTNYGWGGAAWVFADNYCQVAIGAGGKYKLSTQTCSGDSCTISGKIKCNGPSGLPVFPSFNLDCHARDGAMPKVEAEATQVACHWPSGHSVIVECTADGSGVNVITW